MGGGGEFMEKILRLLMLIRIVNAEIGLTLAKYMNLLMDCLRPKD